MNAKISVTNFETLNLEKHVICPGKGIVYLIGFYTLASIYLKNKTGNFSFFSDFPFYKIIRTHNKELVVPLKREEMIQNMEIICSEET